MKLEKRTSGSRLGRARSAELIRPSEEMPERMFDPRLDLGPGVYEELRKTVKRTSPFLGPKIFKIPRLSWMSWFDPTYRDDLRGIERYKERQFDELERSFELARATPGNLVEVNRSAAYFLQEFPEARPDLSKFTSSVERARSMMEAMGRGQMRILQNYLVVWLQLWPEARNELVNRFFPNGVDEYINAFITNPSQFLRLVERIHFVAQVMLAFPEQRKKLLKVVEPYVEQIHGVLDRLSQSISRENFNEYHQLIGDLTIIGAEQAYIDEQGLIRVQLQPLEILPKTSELPQRDLV